MFENIGHFFKRIVIKPEQKELASKDAAKERLHLVLMQDRANVSADFLELMKQEIIDVIKKYIVVDESSIDVRLTNQSNNDGTTGAPALYANIPIVNIKNDMMAEKVKEFEGVDFNKEMGISIPENEKEDTKKEIEEEDKPERVEEISEQNDDNKEESVVKEETEINQYNDIKDENKVMKSNEDESDEENEEEPQTSNVDYVDEEEDDDDVTFDDLLKAAEEEEKKEKNKKS